MRWLAGWLYTHVGPRFFGAAGRALGRPCLPPIQTPSWAGQVGAGRAAAAGAATSWVRGWASWVPRGSACLPRPQPWLRGAVGCAASRPGTRCRPSSGCRAGRRDGRRSRLQQGMARAGQDGWVGGWVEGAVSARERSRQRARLRAVMIQLAAGRDKAGGRGGAPGQTVPQLVHTTVSPAALASQGPVYSLPSAGQQPGVAQSGGKMSSGSTGAGSRAMAAPCCNWALAESSSTHLRRR